MVPRSQIVFVDADATVGGFLDLARRFTFTRFPLYDSHEKRFRGVVSVRDVLSHPSAEDGDPVRDFARQPLFIAEETPADEIFPILRASRQPVALARSAQEQVIGLVTTEDVLREIVGEL
jgi:CBS domain containing-hemolysin-like protein